VSFDDRLQGGNRLTCVGISALAKALEVNNSLRVLILVSCGVVFIAVFAGDVTSCDICLGLIFYRM
jgi:hypothetical protein